MLIKKTMKGELDLLKPAMAIGKELMGIPSFKFLIFQPTCLKKKPSASQPEKVFLMVAGGESASEIHDGDQLVCLLLNASEILNQIYMAESAVLKAEKHFSAGSVGGNGTTEPLQNRGSNYHCAKKESYPLQKATNSA